MRHLICWLSIFVLAPGTVFGLAASLPWSQNELLEVEAVLVAGVRESATRPAVKFITRCGDASSEWDRNILVEGRTAPQSAIAKFSREEDCGFDVVSYVYDFSGFTIATRQTLRVWSVTISGQDLTGSNEAVAQKVTALARQWLRGFEKRAFRYAFEIEGKRGLCLTTPIPEESFWHDTMKAIVHGGNITFVCLKRYSDDMPTVPSARSSENRTWFADFSPAATQ